MVIQLQTLKYVHTHIDDLLAITRGMYDGHLKNAGVVLYCLQAAELRIHVKKSSFELHVLKFLGYIITVGGMQSHPEKVSTSLI